MSWTKSHKLCFGKFIFQHNCQGHCLGVLYLNVVTLWLTIIVQNRIFDSSFAQKYICSDMYI